MDVHNRILKVDFRKLFICRNRKTDTQIHMEMLEAMNSQNNHKKNKFGAFTAFSFKTDKATLNNQNSVILGLG